MRTRMYSNEIVKMCTDAHYTADAILKILQTKYPAIGQSTVYRTLRILVKEGIIQKREGLGPQAFYEVTKEQHAHFVDQKTGEVYDIDFSDKFMDYIILPKGLVSHFAELTIHGHKKDSM